MSYAGLCANTVVSSHEAFLASWILMTQLHSEGWKSDARATNEKKLGSNSIVITVIKALIQN